MKRSLMLAMVDYLIEDFPGKLIKLTRTELARDPDCVICRVLSSTGNLPYGWWYCGGRLRNTEILEPQ